MRYHFEIVVAIGENINSHLLMAF